MTETPRFTHYDNTPVYTIKTVVQETGIAPATLRAWERRYGCLSPGRSDGGYRLYSERDIAVLRWLKHQVDTGVSISRAVALLEIHQHKGAEAHLLETRLITETRAVQGIRSTTALVNDLMEALLAFQEASAEMLLSEAFALYPMETVFEEIVSPLLITIGERWHSGETSIIQEHFATAFLRRRLTALFQAYEQPRTGPLVITGAAPAEWHDIGILLVSLTLRRHGWRVIYLGQNVPAEQLIEEIGKLRPDLICLSATTHTSAVALSQICDAIHTLPEPRPRLIVGGQAFSSYPELRARFPCAYLAISMRDLIDQVTYR